MTTATNAATTTATAATAATAANNTNTNTNTNTNNTGGNTMTTATTSTNKTDKRNHANKDKAWANKSARLINNSKTDKVGVLELPKQPTKFPASSRKKYNEKISAFLADAKNHNGGMLKADAAINNFILREKYSSQIELSEFLKELQGVALWPAGKKPASPSTFFGKKSAWAISEDRKFFVKDKTGEKARYDVVRFCFMVWKSLANKRAKDKANTALKISIGLEEAIALNNAITELQKYALTSKDTMLQELNSALVAARTASGLSEKVEKQLES